MLNIAIIDDDVDFAGTMKEYLVKYQEEESVKFFIKTFHNAIDFLADYKSEYNIILMDIEMPQFDGLEAAKEIRTMDEHVSIIFVTNMGQLAIRGYEVDATDFIVKPVGYYNFRLKLKKAIERGYRNREEEITLEISNGMVRVLIKDIKYIEVDKHYLLFYVKDSVYRVRGTLSDIEKKLHSFGFSRCNNCYIVNFRFVTSYKDNTVYLGAEQLQMSRPRRKAFVDELTAHLG